MLSTIIKQDKCKHITVENITVTKNQVLYMISEIKFVCFQCEAQ